MTRVSCHMILLILQFVYVQQTFSPALDTDLGTLYDVSWLMGCHWNIGAKNDPRTNISTRSQFKPISSSI